MGRVLQPAAVVVVVLLFIDSSLTSSDSSDFITVTDCDGTEFQIPISGSDASAIDSLMMQVTAASDTNGFAKSVYAQMLSKVATLKNLLATSQTSSGTSSWFSSLIGANSKNPFNMCRTQDDPDAVTSAKVDNDPVFVPSSGTGNGVLEDEPRSPSGSNGFFDSLVDAVGGTFLNNYAKTTRRPTRGTFHSDQVNVRARDILSADKARKLELYQGDMIYAKSLVEGGAKNRLGTSRLGSALSAATPVSTTSSWSPWNYWPEGKVNWYVDQSGQVVDECAIATFRTSASYVEKYTCLRFTEGVPASDSINSVKLTSDGNTCWAYVGMSSESQVNLGGSGCQIPGIAMHEMGHAIGLVHQHSRLDRDSYLTVDWNDVQDAAVMNFYKISSEGSSYDTQSTAIPYDYSSVMHYGACEFSTDSSRSAGCRQTLTPADSSVTAEMGQRDHLSPSDILLINTLYGCSATCGDGIQNQGEEGVDCGGPCRAVCHNSTSDGIVPLPSQCESSSRSLTTTEIIILVAIIGLFAGVVFLGFYLCIKHRNLRKEETKKRLLTGNPQYTPEQVRRLLRQRTRGAGGVTV